MEKVTDVQNKILGMKTLSNNIKEYLGLKMHCFGEMTPVLQEP